MCSILEETFDFNRDEVAQERQEEDAGQFMKQQLNFKKYEQPDTLGHANLIDRQAKEVETMPDMTETDLQNDMKKLPITKTPFKVDILKAYMTKFFDM